MMGRSLGAWEGACGPWREVEKKMRKRGGGGEACAVVRSWDNKYVCVCVRLK
jgi:hypothetical protein